MEALAANNRQVGGQYVNLGQEQYLVRGLGLVANTTDIGNVVIAEREGVPIHVKAVSYTHLDVYKRQTMSRPPVVAWVWSVPPHTLT